MDNKLLNDLLDLFKKIPEYLAEELERQNERLESYIKEQEDLRKNIELPKFTDKEFSNKTDIGIKHDAMIKGCMNCKHGRDKDGNLQWCPVDTFESRCIECSKWEASHNDNTI